MQVISVFCRVFRTNLNIVYNPETNSYETLLDGVRIFDIESVKFEGIPGECRIVGLCELYDTKKHAVIGVNKEDE